MQRNSRVLLCNAKERLGNAKKRAAKQSKGRARQLGAQRSKGKARHCADVSGHETAYSPILRGGDMLGTRSGEVQEGLALWWCNSTPGHQPRKGQIPPLCSGDGSLVFVAIKPKGGAAHEVADTPPAHNDLTAGKTASSLFNWHPGKTGKLQKKEWAMCRTPVHDLSSRIH